MKLQAYHRYWLLACFCGVLGASVASAQDDVPTHTVDGEFIKEWLVLGPFFPNDLEKDFLVDVGGEENVNPKADDPLTTADGRALTWKRYTSSGHVIGGFPR